MADPAAIRFGPLLRRFRLFAGFSQEQLAARAGLSVDGISALETGRRAKPRLATIRLLADALGLDDAGRAMLLVAGRPGTVRPPPAAPAAPPAALPAPLAAAPLPDPPTRLVGREREVAAICALLRPDDRDADGGRLLTLTGPGGVGKTRLAIAGAREIAATFTDGAAWVEFAPLNDAALVPGAIATALGLPDSGRRLMPSLKAALRERELLLILDNCEHLPAAAAPIAYLVAACPKLTVLATSRQRLHLRREHELAIEPLAAPTQRHRDVAGEHLVGLAAVASIRLFIERAAKVWPGFALTEANAANVVEICRRLDGLPLAIELAAARLKVLSPAELLVRLERRLPLLAGGAHDQPSRQQTMRNAIAWSYDLLDPRDQALFRRLAVFAGGFRLNDAEALVGDGNALAVLDGVTALVGQSLVRREKTLDDALHFTMLETIREFAQERLAESGQEAAVRDAHAAYFLSEAERLEFAAITADGERMLARLEDDLGNMRAALSWVDKRGDDESRLRLAGALGWFWFAHSHYREGEAALTRALARGADQPPALRAKAMIGLARIVSFRGDSDRAEALYRSGLKILRAEDDALRTALALTGLGALASHRQRYEQATTLLEEALAHAARLEEPAQSAVAGIASTNLGVAAKGLGRLAQARLHYEAALNRYHASGYAWGEIRALRDLGDVARDGDDLQQAWTRYRESLALAEACGDTRLISDAFAGLATVAAGWDQPERAAHLLGAAERLRDAAGTPIMLAADRTALERRAAAVRGALGETAFMAALAVGRSLSLADAIGEAGAVGPPDADEADISAPSRQRLWSQ